MEYQSQQEKQPQQTMPVTTQPANIVYVTVPQQQVGPDPTSMICPHCNATITSSIEPQTSMKTHLFCILLCAIGCICCAPFVYCTDSCLAKKHSCPNCHKFLGMYDK